jgi:hypothetical protein
MGEKSDRGNIRGRIMDITKEKKASAGMDALRFIAIFVGLVLAASFLSLAASTKVFLIGAAFIALAVWGKRKVKQEHKP